METVWRLKPADRNLALNLAYELEVPLPVASIYVSRGMNTVEEAEKFCNLSPKLLHDPMLLPDIQPVLQRLVKALDKGEHIHVHGDYDVDGVTATATVVYTLKKLGANLTYHVPHRIVDGYDLKPKTIQDAKDAGVDLLISVDCGIVAFEAADHAKSIGLDLIITDHHHPSFDGRIPDCIGVVNPNRHDSEYPFKGLAGVGIAYKVMQALARLRGIPVSTIRPHLLDYVALGTVADVAPMLDENRVLVQMGCQLLAAAHKPGVAALLEIANVKRVNPTAIGFFLGPRINAVGRLADPSVALDLLLETNETRATFLANQMDTANKRRQSNQEQVVAEAISMIPADIEDRHILVLWAKDWHPGLVGLVAGKIAEQYGRPTLVCTIKEDGNARGSCRSTRSFNILEALKSEGCGELFTKCGGHAFAAGFDLPAANLPLLAERLNSFAKTKGGIESVRVMDIDARIQPGDINEKTYNSILEMSPFGSGNPEPLLMAKGMKVVKSETVGADGKHLKMRLKGPHVTDQWIDAMAWRQGDQSEKYPENSLIDVLFKLSMDEFRGRTSLTMIVEDLKLSES